MVERRGGWDLQAFYRLEPAMQAFWFDRERAIVQGLDQPDPKGVTGRNLSGSEEADYLRRVAERRASMGVA